MPKLFVYRGLPGSGKSTLATEWVAQDPVGRAQVNRDSLRLQMHNGVFIKGSKDQRGTEQSVIAARDAMVRELLRSGIDVVSSDTNLPSYSVKDLVKIAVSENADYEVIDMTNVPLEVCIQRDRDRENPVGEEVIRGLHSKYLKGKKYPLPFSFEPKPELTLVPYVPDLTKRRAWLVDLDGTVAINGGVRGYHDYDKVDLDSPNWPVIRVVKILQEAGNEIIFFSGRKDYCRDKTIEWIKKYIFPSGHFQLFMRATFQPDGSDNNRKDYIVKLEMFNEHIRDHYNVQGVLDDRLQVVRMWHKLGVPLFRVGDPEADF